MRKIIRYILILSIVILMTGCEETTAISQSVISNTNEMNQDKPAEREEATSIEADETLEKSEIGKKKVQTELPEDSSQVSESSSAANNDEESKENEFVAEEPTVVEPSYEEIVIGEVKEGSIITFGRYEQDNNAENGPEPIEWTVYEISDGKATLIPVKCLMWGLGVECDEKIEDFNMVAFNDYERKHIATEPCLMTAEFIAKKLTCKSSGTDGSAVYKKDTQFEFMKNYTESVIAQGAEPVYVKSGNIVVNHYMIWTFDHTASWSDSNDELNNSIGIHPVYKRETSTYRPFGICPYIVIYTENN